MLYIHIDHRACLVLNANSLCSRSHPIRVCAWVRDDHRAWHNTEKDTSPGVKQNASSAAHAFRGICKLISGCRTPWKQSSITTTFFLLIKTTVKCIYRCLRSSLCYSPPAVCPSAGPARAALPARGPDISYASPLPSKEHLRSPRCLLSS